jgi:assimilatory nitrate reductase catalytic subunit
MNAIDPAMRRQIRPTRTACPYCGVGCGVLATPDGLGGAAISGDPDHPANSGRLCSKGSALGETLGLENRLLYPMIRCSKGSMERIAWTDALDHVAHRLRHIVARDGPGAVAFYLSGQLLTEDYYVANKLMKGFVGSANVDTNSRLCMASSVAGHRRAFGADTVPGCYEDLDEADLLVLVGSNAAWCHPVLFQRMLSNKQRRGARIVVVDPRRTDTAEDADLFLGLKPGTDTALFCGLLAHLADADLLDRDYIEQHTTGFDAALARARIGGSVAATALATGLSEQEVAAFFQMFAATPRVVTLYSQGVNQSAQGTDKVNAIVNCHLATGRIGKKGQGPFSLTGQPNAMGGREVGGLANQLAAHMGFTPPEIDRVRRFWKAPRIATHEGLKAVQMFDAIGRGEIKALWVMGTNPAVSLPDADSARAALKKLELLVVSENVLSNDTVDAGVHVLLPAQAWGEKSGTVTNSERRISRQRAFLEPPGESRPDWWIVGEVAKRLGFGAAFDFHSPAEIFREHAALSAFENNGSRDFDIGALQSISDEAFDALAPVQWPHRLGDTEPQQRLFAEGGFFSNDRRARFVVPEVPALRTETNPGRPLRLNTGRIRDQWHTMTRTGTSPRLGQHLPEPFVEVHPDDAARNGLADGDFARVVTDYGKCTLKVVISDRQQRGMLFAPIHWSEATASAARVGALVAPLTDPFSGQPESKATPASISPYEYVFRGFVLSRTHLKLPDHAWWARATIDGGFGYLVADNADLSGWSAWLRSVAGSDLAEYCDFGGGVYRAATFAAGRIETCLFLGPARDAGDWNIVKELFAADLLGDDQRRMLLSGKSMEGLASKGPIVCACFSVGRHAICDTIAAGARSAAEIGIRLKAGTNCGSCIPELKQLIAQTAASNPDQRKMAASHAT